MVTGTEHICGVVESPNLLPVCVLQLITTARQEKGSLKEDSSCEKKTHVKKLEFVLK